MPAEEEHKELPQQVRQPEDKLDALSDRLQNLEAEYKSDKKVIRIVAGVVGFCLLAFLGWTTYSIPGRVTAALDAFIVRETTKAVQQHKAQIEEQAKQIGQYASDAKNNANEIANIKATFEKDLPVLNFTDCGKVYSCTPKACLAKCIELGMSMATYDEVYSWASAGEDYCSIMWMLDSRQPGSPVSGYPMYHNQTIAKRCGRTDTGDIPRMEDVTTSSWDSEETFDCACSNRITR